MSLDRTRLWAAFNFADSKWARHQSSGNSYPLMNLFDPSMSLASAYKALASKAQIALHKL